MSERDESKAQGQDPDGGAASPAASEATVGRTDLEAGLRFLHVLGMQGRIATDETSQRLEALVQELAARVVALEARA